MNTGTEVGDPSGHENRRARPGQVFRRKRHRRGVHGVARAIQRHDDHDETAQDDQRLNACAGHLERVNSRRTGHADPSGNPGRSSHRGF
jgi:hypothetical protein